MGVLVKSMIKIIILMILFVFSPANAMELLLKVGHTYPEGHEKHERGWKDGQIIDIREDGFQWGNLSLRDHAVIEVKDKFWESRGSTDWQSTDPQVLEFNKLVNASDSNGKYSWEADGISTTPVRKRDFFIDFIKLKKDGDISEEDYIKIKSKKKKQKVKVNKNIDQIIKKEGKDKREKE
jgi:hypothetical protein